MRECWQLWDKALPKERCEEIINICKSRPMHDATIFSGNDYETKKDFTESRYLNQETSDDVVDTDKILNFHDANRIRVYFKGKYLYEFDMTYDQFNAFREILANYDYL